MKKSELARTVSSIVSKTKVLDVHTHLYSARFGKLLLAVILLLNIVGYLGIKKVVSIDI